MREIEVQIQDVAFGGAGVARSEGKVIFVPFTITGESVTACITREKKQFAQAELGDINEASRARVVPRCPYFGRCGGCSYQHMSYQHQLEVKARQVEQAMRRIGRIAAPPLQPIVPSPQEYAYRNRITVHAQGGLVGYYKRDSQRLLDVERCPIAAPEVNAKLAELRARKPADGHYTLRAHAGPRVFEQTNPAVAEALAQIVEQTLPDGHRLLIDAYCGAGFFSKRLTHKFERVVGIEWDRYAIAVAQENTAPNESYIAGDVGLALGDQLAIAEPATTSVILDPPATGLAAGVRQALLDRPAHTLVYVSCNPTTLARDLQELQARYTIVAITPLDMFPQTAEIECAVHLRSV
ncbi:MAG: class I SAM-dependent RNA methyltransferase [Chthoniobacterales bacterium]